MSDRRIVRLVVRGRVQGVGFRAWMQRQGELRDLSGWVRNRRDGSVEAVVAGPAQGVEQMIDACRQGPGGSQVTALELAEADEPALAGQAGFRVVPTA